MTAFYGMLAGGRHVEERASNRLDGGSHFYNVYETLDGKFVSVAPTEPKFFAILMGELGLDPANLDQADQAGWIASQERLAAIFKTKTRAEWNDLLADKDTCLAPVLSMSEAPQHPHNIARGNFAEVEGVVQPAPAPKFSRSPSKIQGPAVRAGEHTKLILEELLDGPEEAEALLADGVAKAL